MQNDKQGYLFELGKLMKKSRKKFPTVKIKSSRYQPTKEELEEPVYIPTSPEQLAKAVTSPVKIKRSKTD